MIKSKKQMFIVIFTFISIIAIGSISYAYFNYTKTGGNSTIVAGDIYMHLNEGNNEISLTNVFPETKEEARSRNDNYITFSISGLNESSRAIYYEILLNRGSNKASPKIRYHDKDLRFDLVELDSNGNEVSYLLSAAFYDNLVDQKIYVDTVSGNTTSQITKYYKLRMWLDENVIISDTATNRDYTTNEFKNGYATVKLSVNGDFIEKSAPKQAYNLIQSLASTKNYIASYDDIINNPNNVGFTTQDQVSSSATKQTVYYFTGTDAAANSNVLFAGYCWQIIRTTDNGGVKLLYNGVAKKPITSSTSLTNTDITYTNDGTYAYTYDSSTKKWTSANAGVASNVDTFTFTVNAAGDYAINYTVSSQKNYDVAKFYINNVLLGQHSGVEEGVLDLGTLTTTDIVKIEYSKNGSTNTGNDNIVFNIASVTERGEIPACSKDRIVTKGINGTNGTTTSLTSATLFGRSYDYNLTTGQFTIEDSTGLPTAWSENDTNNNGKKDYEELIGTYTCGSSSTTCTTLYYVGSYVSSTNAYTASYTIGNVAHYSQMGTSAYNANKSDPALVGYMFNKEYNYKTGSKSDEYYTNAVWENGAYTLSSGNSGTSPDATHHYICDTDCTKVRYYYYSANYYILLENGKTVEDALKEMINYKANANDADENINVYNSAIKGYLDNWYKKNLTAYASYLDEKSVFCNDRSVRDLGGWNPSGTNLSGYLQFNQYSANKNLNCVNEMDRFSKSNNKAKLDYPIGVLSEPERNLMTGDYAKTGENYWAISPRYFTSNTAYACIVYTTGDTSSVSVHNGRHARGVVTLKPGTLFESGDGTYTNPYIVGPIVNRSE